MRNDQRYTLAVVLMTSFITTFTGSALNLSIPSISIQFDAGAVSAGWIITGYLLASAALSVPFGRFSDIFGKRPVLITGTIVFTICSILCAISWNIRSLILFRLMQGAGASMIFATNTAILAASCPSETRGKTLGLSVSTTYLGLSLGPVAGGVINQHLGWRAVFWFVACYCFFMTALAILKLQEPEILTDHKEPVSSSRVTGKRSISLMFRRIKLSKLDIAGCALYILAVISSMYGLTSLMTGVIPKLCLVTGIFLIIIFISHEKNTIAPLIDMDLFTKNAPFAWSNAAAFLNYGASYAVSYLISIYLQNVRGYASQTAGLILITNPVFQAILSPVSGKISDKTSPHRLSSYGMAITAAGIFMLTFISAETPIIYILSALAVIGIGSALFSSPNSNAVMGSISANQYSIASSVMATSRSAGHTFSMAAVSSVVAATIGNSVLSEAPSGSVINAMRISFVIFTISCTAGIYCSARRK